MPGSGDTKVIQINERKNRTSSRTTPRAKTRIREMGIHSPVSCTTGVIEQFPTPLD